MVKSTVAIMKEKAAKRVKQAKKGKVGAIKRSTGKPANKSVTTKAKQPVPTKQYSERDLKHFKEIILEKKTEMMEELETLKETMMDVTTGEYVSESSTYSLHMEQGTDAMEREKTFLFASRGSKFVNQLDDALARIDNGTYGVCRVCQLLVPKERLEAVPTAQTCAEYKNTNVPCERGRTALAKMKKR
ncbi:MAG: molecular chaperone DnaK [Bacteroidetes bacterium]|nr:molecular chaperone DnaK [Bacteroidota bacterium]